MSALVVDEQQADATAAAAAARDWPQGNPSTKQPCRGFERLERRL